MDLHPDISAHLDRLRDGLLELVQLHGLYLYGSLTTGDFSPARSDLDVIAVPEQPLGGLVPRQLERLHTGLAGAGGPFARLNCLYVPAGRLSDAEALHHYWFGDRFTKWQLKVMTMAELAHSGLALYGPWPPDGLGQVSLAEVQASVRAELDDYWRSMVARPRIWLQDTWVDFGLVTLPRAAAVLRDGELITKSAAIRRLPDFGVPDWLAAQISSRRAGTEVPTQPSERRARADLVRQIMAAGINRLTRSN
jgi:hypothetical protein